MSRLEARGRNQAIVGLAVLAASLIQSPTPTSAQTVASITVGHTVRGLARTGAEFRFELTCATPDGAPVAKAVTFDLAMQTERRFTVDDLPGLTLNDRCSVRTLANDGGETQYTSTVPKRADGSQPDAVPGVIGVGGYRSAPTPADGRTILAVTTFGGDLTIRKVVEGAPNTSVALYELSVSCDGGYRRSLLLGDGQQEVLTAIPSGSVCRVTETRGGGATARFVDNSGPLNDATVVIATTRPECWDLRTTSPECRATVTIVNQFSGEVDDAPVSTPPTTTSETTTTNVEQRNDETADKAAAPATAAPVAPAPVAEPEVADEEELTVG